MLATLAQTTNFTNLTKPKRFVEFVHVVVRIKGGVA